MISKIPNETFLRNTRYLLNFHNSLHVQTESQLLMLWILCTIIRDLWLNKARNSSQFLSQWCGEVQNSPQNSYTVGKCAAFQPPTIKWSLLSHDALLKRNLLCIHLTVAMDCGMEIILALFLFSEACAVFAQCTVHTSRMFQATPVSKPCVIVYSPLSEVPSFPKEQWISINCISMSRN